LPSAADEDRSFAYEPPNVRQGDTVVVASAKASLMRGRNVVGTAAKGCKLKVLRVQGPWVGTQLDTDRGQVGGWIWYSDVAPANVSN